MNSIHSIHYSIHCTINGILRSNPTRISKGDDAKQEVGEGCWIVELDP
jgi:hypothetical protein